MNSKNKNKSKFGANKPKRFQKHQFDRNNVPKKAVFRHSDPITEAQVGITEFLSDISGFDGVIKARYSDFHVSEVDQNGTLAVLTNTDIPKEETTNVDFDSLVESPLETIPLTTWNDIKEMVEKGSKNIVKLDVSDLNKEERTILHEKVKEIFGNRINSNTIDEEDKKFVIFKKPTFGKDNFIRPFIKC